MATVTREEILAAKLKRESVEAFGGQIVVQELTAGDRDVFELEISERSKRGEPVNIIRSLLVCLSCVNDDGKRLFQDSDIDAIKALSAADVDKIYEVAARLSGIGNRAQEEAVKNSDGSQPDVSA